MLKLQRGSSKKSQLSMEVVRFKNYGRLWWIWLKEKKRLKLN
jgi:hypothetical protein